MNKSVYKVGSHLATKDGTIIGNSIILKVSKRCPSEVAKLKEYGIHLDTEDPVITIATDFGNVLVLSPSEIESMFVVLPPWSEEEASGDFSRRLTNQEALLTELKEFLQNNV